MLTTTLKRLQRYGACSHGWSLLVKNLETENDGKEWPRTKPISYEFILKSNGLYDTIWALRAGYLIEEADKTSDKLIKYMVQSARLHANKHDLIAETDGEGCIWEKGTGADIKWYYKSKKKFHELHHLLLSLKLENYYN